MALINTVSSATMWAHHNPNRPRLPTRQRLHHCKETTATQQLLRVQCKAKATQLTTDLKAYKENCENSLVKIATKHSKKIDYLWRLLNMSSAYKRSCQPSLANAILHHKAHKLNNGKC